MGKVSGQGQSIVAGRVIMTGFMGSGKTAVGRGLARSLGFRFIDTDTLVERRMGMSISDAFATRGEAFFRDEEEAVIREVLAEPEVGAGAVISLGGGAVTTAGVRALLGEEETVILLDVDVATAFERSRGGDRPLARERDEFEKIYRDRKELYRQVADTVIDVGNKEIEEVVGEIRAELVRRSL